MTSLKENQNFFYKHLYEFCRRTSAKLSINFEGFFFIPAL